MYLPASKIYWQHLFSAGTSVLIAAFEMAVISLTQTWGFVGLISHLIKDNDYFLTTSALEVEIRMYIVF